MIRTLTEIAWEWGVRCFGLEHMLNKNVRALRFGEEAIELIQACGVPENKVLELVRMVYARPAGNVRQEIGGSMVTLSVLSRQLGYDIETAFDIEVRRCLTKDPAHFAKRNKEKIDLGMA